MKTNEINREMYLDLIKKALMDILQIERPFYLPVKQVISTSWKVKLLRYVDNFISKKNFLIVQSIPVSIEDKLNGKGLWPQSAQTMVGIKRLDNIQFCVEQTIKNNVPGDLIETGVWRGGSTIFMRAILKAYGIADKAVWVADSFEGLPKPKEHLYQADKGDVYHTYDELKVSLEEVQDNFRKYNLLDSQVRFLKGWFSETLPSAPIEKLSVLRLDGDMYESTLDALVNLYPKLSVGGYIIVDDYHWIKACRQAVTDYREQHDISDEIIDVDWTAIYWQKTK